MTDQSPVFPAFFFKLSSFFVLAYSGRLLALLPETTTAGRAQRRRPDGLQHGHVRASTQHAEDASIAQPAHPRKGLPFIKVAYFFLS